MHKLNKILLSTNVKRIQIKQQFCLAHFLPMKNQDVRQENEKKAQLDISLTVRALMSKVRENFPSSYKSLMEGDFIKNSRSFVDSILSSPEKLQQVLENLPNNCEVCGENLEV